MRVIRFIIRNILNLIFIIVQGIAQGLWSVIRGILTGVSRWIGRVVLPIGLVFGMLWFGTKSMPPEQLGNVIGQLIAIAIVGYAIWNMITSPFRSHNKRRRRR